MNKFDKLSSTEKAEVIVEKEDHDDTIRHKREINEDTHKIARLFLRLVKFSLVFFFIFAIFLIFIILPVSEMTSNNEITGGVFERWTVAFTKTAGTLGITLATITIPIILQKLYGFFKKYIKLE